MRLGEIGEQAADESRSVVAGEVDRPASEPDRFEVFAASSAEKPTTPKALSAMSWRRTSFLNSASAAAFESGGSWGPG